MQRSFKINENPKTLEEAMESEAEKERFLEAIEKAGEDLANMDPKLKAAFDKLKRRMLAAKAKHKAELKKITDDFETETVGLL